MQKHYPLLTSERLRELLSYDPETGIFRRLVSVSINTKPGDVAGSPNNHGYLRITVDKRRYKSHRLAWLYVYGCWPTTGIDHINGVPSDNRIANLREATQAENCQNLAISPRNSSGHPGVGWNKQDRKWRAYIQIEGRYHHLGCFKSIEDAIAARNKAKASLHGFQPFDRQDKP